MTFVPNSAVARCSVEYQQGTRPMANVLYVSSGDSFDEGLLLSAATLVYNTIAATWLPLLHTTTVLQSVTAYSMASTTAPVASYSPVTPATGEVTGEVLPLQSAAVLTLRTAARGRSGRGRVYISGWGESSSSGSSLTPAAAAALITAAEAFLAALTVGSFPWVVYSQFSGNAPRPIGLDLAVTEVELRSSVFGSQRNRNKRESSS